MSVLTKITAEAKRIRKAHPNKYKNLSNPWSSGFIAEAARNVKRGKKSKPAKKKAAKKKPVKRKVAAKRKPVKRKRAARVRAVGSLVPRKVGKKRTTRKRATTRKVSGQSRRRSVGKKDKTLLVLGLGALAVGAVYLATRNNRSTSYQGQPLPPLQQTGNATRDQQSNNILQWAMAGGMALSAITQLIAQLNHGSDQEVDSIYKDTVTGGGSDYIFT